MKIKTPIDFLTFNDGTADIYEIDDNDNIIKSSLKKFRFGNRTVGVNRYFAARQNDINLSKVIHIHQFLQMRTDYAVVIDGTRYKVIQVQHLADTNPKCTVLSLEQRGLYEGAEKNAVY